MKRYTASEKILIVDKVVKEGVTAYSVCKAYGISKPTFYSWLKRYLRGKKNRALALESKVKSFGNHPKSIDYKGRLRVLGLVHKHPEYSCHKIARVLAIGNHGVQGVLAREGLGRFEARVAFSKKPFWKRESAERRLGMLELYRDGWKVSEICKLYGVSKQTFGKWRKRYEQGGVLDDGFIRGERHHKFLGKEQEGQILDFVSKNPAMSVHKIADNFSGIVGHHGVQNILARHHLGTYEQRLAFSRLSEDVWKPNIKPSDLPYIPLRIWRLLYAPFATIPKIGWLFTRGQILLLFIVFLSFYFYKLVAVIVTSPTGNPVGTFLASISLTFGLFFLIYSMKYYIGGFLVLRLAQSAAGGDSSKLNPSTALEARVQNSKFTELINKFGFNFAKRQTVNPLNINLEEIELDAQRPFVSIHVALYNEKHVVERLIRACTGQEWFVQSSKFKVPADAGAMADRQSLKFIAQSEKLKEANYEVILADDSTDETTEIVKQTLIGAGWKQMAVQSENFSDENPKFKVQTEKQEEIFVFSKQGAPTVKINHRFSRAGYKGAALQRALENTDKRAQYIVVFDADFVPYPDTITQFIKTFQVLTPVRPISHPIAAVQGYQWHVLNKGANWVTRGVRTEYAGSYVIERASEEIYQGLKQIAGSVYAIRTDVLRELGWGTSITEDFELTLKLYEAGYKVAFTPYIQAPAEAASTIKRLIHQRMRWAEGASFNVKLMFGRMLRSPRLSRMEKLEFVYLAPYYLQAAFFIIGTLSWFLAEAVFGSRLPFWTVAFGWSLVFTNLFALPLMNVIGLFLEESEERDYVGILSFVALSYILVPFQAYAAIKGFTEKEEGPWFRTPKTGLITDTFGRSGFNKFFGDLFGRRPVVAHVSKQSLQSSARSAGLSNANHFAFVPAHNPLRGGNFGIRPRHLRWAGNLALGVVIAITVLISVFAPVIPNFSNAYAEGSGRKLSTIVGGDGDYQGNVASDSVDGEISNPMATSYPLGGGKTLEYIFHSDPRVRTKIDGKELEVKFEGFEGLDFKTPKKSSKEHNQYKYEGIYDGIDMKYEVNGDTLTEQMVLSKYEDIRALKYSLKGVDLEGMAGEDQVVYFASKDGGEPLFTFTKPYLYEERNPHDKFFGIEYQLEKTALGWDLKKVLTEEGRNWLADPSRVFPVIIDPTQVVGTIATGISTTEARYGSVQRKVAYMPNATGGAAWYAVYQNGSDVFYEKSTDGATWTGSAVDMNTADADNESPSLWKEGDTLWVAWFDNSVDTIEFVSLNTTDDSLGNVCTMTDLGGTADGQVSIAVTDNGNVYTAMSNPADTEIGVFRATAFGAPCTFAAITTGSGLTANDPVDLVTAGNNVYMIYDDGDLSASIYGDDGSGNWDTSNQDINAGTASNADGDFSVATDGTDIWIVQATTTAGTESFRCANCVSDPTSPAWTDIDEPFSSQSDGSYVSVGYISTGNTIVAMYMTGAAGTSEVVNWKTSDADTILWSANNTFGFTPQTGGMDSLSSTMIVTSDTQFGAVSDEVTATDLEFSTLPENLWVLLFTIPIWPKLFRKMKKKKRRL